MGKKKPGKNGADVVAPTGIESVQARLLREADGQKGRSCGGFSVIARRSGAAQRRFKNTAIALIGVYALTLGQWRSQSFVHRIAEWQAMLLKRGGKAVKDEAGKLHDRPLSAKTVFHAFTLLNGALRFALRMELVFRNPCEAVTRPSVERSEAKALTQEEIAALLDAARSTRWEPYLTLALCTGARRGELCGLSWDDFDAEARALVIRRSLSQTRDGIALKSTKNGRVRTVPLSRMAIEALRSQRALQACQRLAIGSIFQNTDNAIFTDEVGRRITPMAASCAFERTARKAKISTTRLHDLRHTAATTLIHAGVDVRTTAGILGHASPTITLSIYAHLMPEAQRDAVNRLGDYLESAVSSQV